MDQDEKNPQVVTQDVVKKNSEQDAKNPSAGTQGMAKKYLDIEELGKFKTSFAKIPQNQLTKVITAEKLQKLLDKIKEADSNKAKKKYESVLKDIREYNLNENTLEIAQVIVDSTLHESKIRFFVEVCAVMSSYESFLPNLQKSVLKLIETLDGKLGNFENEDKRAQKRKNMLRLLGELHLFLIPTTIFVDLMQRLLPMNKSLDFLLPNLQVIQNFMKHFAPIYFGTFRYDVREEVSDQEQLKKVWERKNCPEVEEFIGQYIKFLESTIQSQRKLIEQLESGDKNENIKEPKDILVRLRDAYRNVKDCLGLYDKQLQGDPTDVLDINAKEFHGVVVDDSNCFTEEEKCLYLKLIDLATATAEPSAGKKDFTSIENVDQLALEFQNTKANRKALLDSIVNNRQNYRRFLPFQCRLIATLSRVYKDLEEDTTRSFIEQYKQIKSVDSQNEKEKKIRYLHYICELTKFRVLKPDIILDFLGGLANDLTPFNVEQISTILESCGRFLKFSVDSCKRFENHLNQLERSQKNKPLDNQTSETLIKALLSITRSDKPKKERPLIHQYIKFILMNKLDRFDKALENLYLLPLSNQQTQKLLVKLLFKTMVKGHPQTLVYVATLMAALREHYPQITGQLVDAVFEEIQAGLEDNNFNKRQRRITVTRMVGDLYSYQILNEDVVMRLLQNILEFGKDSPDAALLDPPDDTFRIMQIIALVESVKEYYKKFRAQLLPFLVRFQHYVLSKQYLSQSVEFALYDLYESFDSRLMKIKSLKTADYLLQNEHNLEEVLTKLPDQPPPQNMIDWRGAEGQKEQEKVRQIEEDFDSKYRRLLQESGPEYASYPRKTQSAKKNQAVVVKVQGEKRIIMKTEGSKKKNVVVGFTPF